MKPIRAGLLVVSTTLIIVGLYRIFSHQSVYVVAMDLALALLMINIHLAILFAIPQNGPTEKSREPHR